jgi:hypothetical protein
VGVFHQPRGEGGVLCAFRSGLLCPNPACNAVFWGAPNAASCFARLFNRVTLTIRTHLRKYYDCWLVGGVIVSHAPAVIVDGDYRVHDA